MVREVPALGARQWRAALACEGLFSGVEAVAAVSARDSLRAIIGELRDEAAMWYEHPTSTVMRRCAVELEREVLNRIWPPRGAVPTPFGIVDPRCQRCGQPATAFACEGTQWDEIKGEQVAIGAHIAFACDEHKETVRPIQDVLHEVLGHTPSSGAL